MSRGERWTLTSKDVGHISIGPHGEIQILTGADSPLEKGDRMAVKKPTPAPVDAGINFGSREMYAPAGAIPEGDYILSDFTVMMHQAEDKQGNKKGQPRLGVMITFNPMDAPHDKDKIRTQFYSMGSNADKMYAPNPETGKGLVTIPGATGGKLNDSTNWSVFVEWLYSSGLPEGIFTNDVSVLDGLWAHVAPVPEPESRKGFRQTAATGEAADQQQQFQGSGTIPVVTEIKDEGKPWEGTGGLPEETAAPAKPAAKAAAKPVAKPAAKAVAKPEPPAETNGAGEADEDVLTAATNAVADVLGRNMNGMLKLKLRTDTFAAAKKAVGEEVANSIINAYFGSDDDLNSVLGPLGYAIAGPQVKPVG